MLLEGTLLFLGTIMSFYFHSIQMFLHLGCFHMYILFQSQLTMFWWSFLVHVLASWTIQLLLKIQTLSKKYHNIMIVPIKVHWYWKDFGLHTHIVHSNINQFENWFEVSMLDPSMSDEERKLQKAQRNTCRHTKRNIWRCNIERNQHLILIVLQVPIIYLMFQNIKCGETYTYNQNFSCFGS